MPRTLSEQYGTALNFLIGEHNSTEAAAASAVKAAAEAEALPEVSGGNTHFQIAQNLLKKSTNMLTRARESYEDLFVQFCDSQTNVQAALLIAEREVENLSAAMELQNKRKF